MGAIDISISHNDHTMISKLVWVVALSTNTTA